jgi:hypothetical protein
MSAQHTPGPWRWELNESNKKLQLVGGTRPQFDLTILEPIRWGMGSASLFVRDTAHDGLNLLHKLHERRDWIKPFPGRAHHARWCAGVDHPDLRLIEAAPELLAKLQAWQAVCDRITDQYGGVVAGVDFGALGRANRAAIAAALGEQA